MKVGDLINANRIHYDNKDSAIMHAGRYAAKLIREGIDPLSAIGRSSKEHKVAFNDIASEIGSWKKKRR